MVGCRLYSVSVNIYGLYMFIVMRNDIFSGGKYGVEVFGYFEMRDGWFSREGSVVVLVCVGKRGWECDCDGFVVLNIYFFWMGWWRSKLLYFFSKYLIS